MEQRPPEPPIPPDHQLPKTTNSHPAPSAPKKSRQWLWVILLLVFAGILFLVLRHKDDTKKQASGGGRHGFSGPVTATGAPAKQGDIGVYLDAIGTVTPVYTATIYNQVAGVITAVHYREGQMVHKGDPLVDIDDRQYRANVETAEGTLAKDQGVLAQAQMDLERYQKAWAANAIAKQTLDDQEKLVLQDQGTVKADQGTLDYDKVQVAYCHIVAPFTGRVGLRLVDPGNLVQASSSTELAVVTQLQPITVVFTVAQDSLPEILTHTGNKAGSAGGKLTVDAYNRDSSQKLATGTLMAIDNQIDTTTGTVKLRAQFDNRDNELFPNLFVNTRLLVTTQHDQTLIPDAAIQHNGDEAFVYVLAPITASDKDTAGNNEQQAPAASTESASSQGGSAGGKTGSQKPGFTARKQDVKVGISDNGVTAVQGINPGDMVATSSFEKLQPGSKVILSKKAIPQDTTESITP
ncbi:efflux RND transporter periplasmic adaptor subunit [Silvibacterium dinghuense]|uniref:efflux RND transporter periplasmic adaptor subunit n=1 Tax=Silvibacterium dinghuense TaxID=1560006 RepID=UPI00195CE419|nr:efflux RND transporter periplasmic adaptor subunit [Silvibacterium dinghuense]GGH14514.1 transport system membrane protein [Silvibacterium dinghuense]